MILVAIPSKPFEYTAKFSARRQAIIATYDAEIQALYDSVEETTQTDLAPPESWTIKSAKDFVRQLVNKVLKSPAADDDDIFQRGCDR